MSSHHTPQTDLKVLINLPVTPVLRAPAKGQGDFLRGKHKGHLSLLQGCSPPSHPSLVPVTLLKNWHLDRNVEGQWPSAFPLNWVPLASQDFSAKAKGLVWIISAGVFQETHFSISYTLSFSFFQGTVLKCPPPCWGLLTTSEVLARNSPFSPGLSVFIFLSNSLSLHTLWLLNTSCSPTGLFTTDVTSVWFTRSLLITSWPGNLTSSPTS